MRWFAILFGGFLLFLVLRGWWRRRPGSAYVEAVPPSVAALQVHAGKAGTATVNVLALNEGTNRTGTQNKIAAINAIRLTCPQHDLVAAKYLVEHLPQPVAAELAPDQADRIWHQLEAAGMTVTIT